MHKMHNYAMCAGYVKSFYTDISLFRIRIKPPDNISECYISVYALIWLYMPFIGLVCTLIHTALKRALNRLLKRLVLIAWQIKLFAGRAADREKRTL